LSNSLINIQTFVDSMFGENAFVISTQDQRGGAVGWVIDPSFPPQTDQLLEYVSEDGIVIEKILLTHGHGDHIAGVDRVRQAHPKAELMIAEADKSMLTDAAKNLSKPFGVELVLETAADGDLLPNMDLTLGQMSWKVLDTSGHSPGGRSFYCADAGIVFVGDALFAGSIGRTDFPWSNHHRLIDNIREHLLSLPDKTVVYSGHGPTTLIGNERKSNPFLTD